MCPCHSVSSWPTFETEHGGHGLGSDLQSCSGACVLGFCWAVFETFSWLLQVNQRPRRTGSQSSTQTGILRKWALEAWTKNSQIFSEELLLPEFSHLKLWSKWVSVACRSVAGAQGAGLALACEGWTQLTPLWCCSFWRIQQSLFFPWCSQMYFGLLSLGWGRGTNPTQTLSTGMSEGMGHVV